MSFLICNLTPHLNKIILIKKYSYSKYVHCRTYYNVLFFGSDSIALNSLKKVNDLRKSANVIKRLDLVTANSSKHKTAIEKFAYNASVELLKWPNLDIKHGEYDIGLIVAFGHLIKQDILCKFPLGMINVHPSLLPRWRGAAPIIHTLLHGDSIAGVSLMKIKPDVFDVGEIINQKKVPISKDVKLPELTQRLSEIGADMLVDCLKNLPQSLDHAQPQSNEGVTYAKKISKTISEVRWAEMTAEEVYNLYRAIYGLYPLTTRFNGKQMKLFNAFLLDPNTENCCDPIGTLEYCERTNSVKVLCSDRKYIYFKTLRIVGKREISALDFYNGYIKNVSLDKRKIVIC